MPKTSKERYAENPEYYRALQKRYREKHKEQVKEYKRALFQRQKVDPAVKEKKRLRWNKWYAENKQQAAQSSAIRYVRRTYKLSMDEAIKLIAQRSLGCQVCGSAIRPAIDHCHKTGTLRGVLCQDCNMAIGRAQDSAELLEALARYIRRSQTITAHD